MTLKRRLDRAEATPMGADSVVPTRNPSPIDLYPLDSLQCPLLRPIAGECFRPSLLRADPLALLFSTLVPIAKVVRAKVVNPKRETYPPSSTGEVGIVSAHTRSNLALMPDSRPSERRVIAALVRLRSRRPIRGGRGTSLTLNVCYPLRLA